MMKLLDVFRLGNFGRWYTKGLDEGWLTYGCMQHNPPMTDEFLEEFNEKFESIQNSFNSEEAEVYRQGNQLVIRLRGMQFPIGKAVIMPDNYALLSKVQLAIRTFNDPEVIVEGHTDSTGSTEVNQQLSQERATAVQEYLVSNNTLPGSSVLAVGYGSSRPLMSNESTEGRAVNRRIDVIITPRRQ